MIVARVLKQILIESWKFTPCQFVSDVASGVRMGREFKLAHANRRHFMATEKSRKRSSFVIYSYFEDSAFMAVKRDV